MPSGLRSLVAACALAAVASAAAADAPVVYVALGDSTGAGVGAADRAGYPARLARRLSEAGVPVRLVNLSVPGATAADLRRDQLPRARAAAPGLVTVEIGINDAVRDRPLGEYAKDLEVVADALARAKVPVVFATLPDVTLAPSASGPGAHALGRRLEAYNAVIRLVAERHGFTVADVWEASQRAVRARGTAAMFAADGFHPSAAGYDLWAEAMRPAVERALGPRVHARHPAGAGASSPGSP